MQICMPKPARLDNTTPMSSIFSNNFFNFSGTFEILQPYAAGMKYWRGGKNSDSGEKSEANVQCRPGPKRALSLFHEFVMTLMRIRLNLPLLLLADLFDVGSTLVSNVTITWIILLNDFFFPAVVHWPSQQIVFSNMPSNFKKHFPKTRVVIDCTEFFVQRPRNKTNQYKTYSQYKSHNTYKLLVGVNPNGAFTFVSDLWGGNASDKHIVQESGFLNLIEKGDCVMADRGFKIEELLILKDAKLIAPPFTRKCANGKGKRLNVSEIRQTALIANLRIHVERAIQRLKTFRILQHTIPSSLSPIASKVVKVVCALCNLKGPLFYDQNQKHKKLSRPKRKKPVKRLSRSVK